MKYDAELILTEKDLKARKFEVPINVAVRLTEQDVEYLRQTKKLLNFHKEVVIKLKLVEE